MQTSWSCLNFVYSSASSKFYQYQPLPSQTHIRYLSIHPGQGTDSLQCMLHTASLASVPSYEALSYVWGSSKKVSRISCDDKIICITANLCDALCRIRLPGESRTLWADSICIDQDNEEEKGSQVKLMGQIYREAKRTLIYLGADGGRGGYVASLLVDVKLRIKMQLDEYGSWDDSLVQDHRWNALYAMIRSPWFTRVWVVQEAAIASEALILYGGNEISWKDVLQLHRWVVTKARFIWRKHGLYLNDCHRTDFWAIETASQERFLELITRAKTLACSDARDRIFAFLGTPNAHVGMSGNLIVHPNYTGDHLEIYQKLVEHWLSRARNLAILSTVEHTVQLRQLRQVFRLGCRDGTTLLRMIKLGSMDVNSTLRKV